MALVSSFYPTSSTFKQQRCFSNLLETCASAPICRFLVKLKDGNVGSSIAVRVCHPCTVKSRLSVIVKTSADIDVTGATSCDAAPEGEKPAVSVENLPLESKLHKKMDQKLRMKLAKRIRLRRKRLVRKRQLRKKGRWPPSKMKTLKNV